MLSLLNRMDAFAGRVTNRLIERIPGPQIDIATTTPIVSFTFDDVPDSALTDGAAILEKHGVRGTFYIAGGLVHQREAAGYRMITPDGCAELWARGHELACHTFAHPNVRHLHGDELARDITRNREFFRERLGDQPRNFAYPYASGSFRARSLLSREFRSARGGLNGVNRGRADRTYLRAVPLQQPEASVTALTNVIDELVENPGWLIFYAHDISDTPTDYGCTPASLDLLVRHAKERGCEILTVDAALDRLGVDA